MPVGFSTRSRWFIAGRVLLFLLLCPLVLILTGPLAARLPVHRAMIVLGAIATIATVLVTAFFLRWDKLRWEDIGAAPDRRSAIRMLLGFALGSLLVALQTCVVLISGHVHWVRTPSISLTSVGTALLAYLMLASREEFAFRGYPLRRLDIGFGPWPAQFAIALIFAMEHVAGGSTWRNAFLGAFVGSLLFGMAALATRGLAVPIGLHAAWNFGQWIIGEKETSGLWTPIVDQAYRLHADHMERLGYLLVFGSATIAFYVFRRRKGSAVPEP